MLSEISLRRGSWKCLFRKVWKQYRNTVLLSLRMVALNNTNWQAPNFSYLKTHIRISFTWGKPARTHLWCYNCTNVKSKKLNTFICRDFLSFEIDPPIYSACVSPCLSAVQPTSDGKISPIIFSEQSLQMCYHRYLVPMKIYLLHHSESFFLCFSFPSTHKQKVRNSQKSVNRLQFHSFYLLHHTNSWLVISVLTIKTVSKCDDITMHWFKS